MMTEIVRLETRIDNLLAALGFAYDTVRQRTQQLRAVEALCQERGKALAEESRERQTMRARVKELEASMIRHFQEEHLAGDGPEIDRWKRRVKELEAEAAREGGALTDALLDLRQENERLRAALRGWDRLSLLIESAARWFAASDEREKASYELVVAQILAARAALAQPEAAPKCERCGGTGDVTCDSVFNCGDPDDGYVNCPDCSSEATLAVIVPEAAPVDTTDYRALYEEIVVRCRKTPGRCFCGVHITPVAQPEAEQKEEKPPQGTQVIDLMQALKDSLAARAAKAKEER